LACCDELAQQLLWIFAGRYSGRKVIKTAAARSTPNASKPVLIWPNAMLSKVVAAVAAPISIGIGHFRFLDCEAKTPIQRLSACCYSLAEGTRREEMGILYVARSAKLGRWASDVGLGKNVYKVGVADGDPKTLAVAGWAGESDWTIVRKREVEGLDQEEALDRLCRKEKMIDPNLYPKLKGAVGVFRLTPARVENHIVVTRALAGESDRAEIKLRPTDYADYLIHNAMR
jgi:hypothetical protein